MIIGVDEVNFSPSLAGDCVVCAYFKKPDLDEVPGVTDSKKLTHKQRLDLFGRLQKEGWYQIQLASVNEIEHLGIYLARNRAIAQAVRGLLSKIQPMFWGDRFKVIIDGKFSEAWLSMIVRDEDVDVESMIGGDEKIYEISAASIIGRIYIDALFEGFGVFYPGYDLENCHGSPSKIMYSKLRASGPTPYHRQGTYGRAWWHKIMRGGQT
jgi:ribonuclease HII